MNCACLDWDFASLLIWDPACSAILRRTSPHIPWLLHPGAWLVQGLPQIKALSSPPLVHGNSHRHTSRRHGAQAAKLESIFNLRNTLNMQMKRQSFGPENIPNFFGFLSNLTRDREPPQKPFITCFCLIVENNHSCQERLWSLHCWKFGENTWPWFQSNWVWWGKQSPEVVSSLNHSVLLWYPSGCPCSWH